MTHATLALTYMKRLMGEHNGNIALAQKIISGQRKLSAHEVKLYANYLMTAKSLAALIHGIAGLNGFAILTTHDGTIVMNEYALIG